MCAGLLASCGGGNEVVHGNPEVATPLRIEVRKHDGAYKWFLNDRLQPTNDEAVHEALEAYSEVVDERAGLEGREPDGVSENPIIFAAPPEAPAKPLMHVIEHVVGVMAYRLRAELQRPGNQPLSVLVELPRDEGLSFTQNSLKLAIVQKGEGVRFMASPAYGDNRAVEHVSFRLSEAAQGGWNDAAYSSVVAKLRDALLRAERQAGESARNVCIPYGSAQDDIQWVTLFVALAAIRDASESKSRTGPPLVAWPGEPVPEPEEVEFPLPKWPKPEGNEGD
ncbi:MAG: hypothetical protein KDB82_12870 [Planctomycetes bacterium]|nr:hypothetical protein [Planctomycetota bacterium]